ncbi:uncharacterized protein LOC135073021 [Ostrinia nubilalis]|uniref:uncharacterized protein LOC135073021 n=1 Tax=Ostrinia nubilalis TaxID=29057 RepID=UPI0030824762
MIQANLQRSKQATAELLKAAEDMKAAIALVQEPYVGSTGTMKLPKGTQVIQCTINRQKPVKAAILIFSDKLRVIHDPQLVTETEAAVLLQAGKTSIGVVSVYYEGDKDIEPYLRRTKAVCQKLNSQHILIGGDVNAWSHWWGSRSNDDRGEAYCSFLNEMDLHVLNVGDTPTFEEYRRGKLCTSIVDVTACSTGILGKIKEWKVDRTLTTSDHNAITFSLVLGETLQPCVRSSTRQYNTKKAKWTEFRSQLLKSLESHNISEERIREVADGEGMDSIITGYTTSIEEACTHAIPKIGHRRGKPTPPWWNETLDEMRGDVLRKKRRIRNAAPARKESVLQEYLKAKEEYLHKSLEAQTESWKEFCTTQDRESMWDGVYRVIRKTAKREDDMLLRGADGATLSPDESANLLASTFYPEDTTITDTPYHTQLRTEVESRAPEDMPGLKPDDPPFTEAEVDAVLKAQNPKKAPGPDGFTSDICANAINASRGVFMAIANKCLELSHFPLSWKAAHVVILRKPGKGDYTHPKSYRPIGLLSVLGKTVEKLMVGRLQWHILPTLSQKQYGFMPQRGTEDALYDLINHVRKELDRKKSVIMISLDIEGAFDNAWWPALKTQLASRGCPRNLYKMVCSYLSDRSITVHYAGAKSTRGTTKGCVQGSIGGPTFWNIILDPLLQLLSGERVHCQAFADDGVLVFSSESLDGMEDNINTVLEKIVNWGVQNKLNFAAHKTQAMLLTKRLKYTPPQIQMSGTTLALVDEIKLLGLIIDKRLNFNAHVTAVCKKSTDIYKQLACAAKVTWGLNGEIIRTIYVAVIEPIMTYGACAWSKATHFQMNAKIISALQRGFAQKICKAYRTTSLTSALILSGTLPLDLRIQENATLYEAKKGISDAYLPPGRKLEEKVKFENLPHPSEATTAEFTLLENMDADTQATHQITGPQIYTDGSKMDGKVGAALTWWENGRETLNDTFKLDGACTVFQSEMYALYRAIARAKESKEPNVNILSDSRSSLELLTNYKLLHPLAKAIREDLATIREEGRNVRLFWLRAHVGTAGNERADELAKTAASKDDSSLDYAEIPLSYIKRKIREETIQKWQDRYNNSETGTITKVFFPDVDRAYRIVRGDRPTHLQTQILTGHGGFGEYLHRFGLRDKPGCECDETESESVWHVLFDCPRFQTDRYNLTMNIHLELNKTNLHKILESKTDRVRLLNFIQRVARIASTRNSGISPSQPTTNTPHTQTTTHTNPKPKLDMTDMGEPGGPGIRLRGVALYMDNNTERLGIAFCNAMGKNTVNISPGLGALLNGSTFKTTMRKKVYNSLQTATVEGVECRIVRKNNKTVVLFATDFDVTEFQLACKVLNSLGTRSTQTTPARKISVDAMIVGYRGGETRDYMGVIQSSKHHEMVIYEDRGQNLSYLLSGSREDVTPQIITDCWDHPVTNPTISGSERLQTRCQEEASRAAAELRTPQNPHTTPASMWSTLTEAAQAIPGQLKSKLRRMMSLEKAVEDCVTPPRQKSEPPPQPRSRADMGQVALPRLLPVNETQDHIINAFLEFVAVTKATRKVSTDTCKGVMQAYQWGSARLLGALMEEAEAAIYNSDTATVLHGKMAGTYMAAYSNTCGFVSLNEEKTEIEGNTHFNTPPEDPIVVVAKCTKVMLDDRILEMAETIAGDLYKGGKPEHWTKPTITWVNGVPGCGKTTWVMSQIDTSRDIIVTTTCEAAKDLREKLEPKIGARAKKRVRTMASLLVNGMSEGETCTRIMVDEALMNHFGSIVMAVQIAQASEALLIGDNNQLPYIDRNNLFPLLYNRPNLITNVTKELLCTYRNPQDVAYALREIYSGIYSAKTLTRSLQLKGFTGAKIPNQEDTLYLVHTQAEKALLIGQGYGTKTGSRTLTIHEAQGLTFREVVIVRTTSKKSHLLQSVPHAVVAISRHTDSCTYYTDNVKNDATARLISSTERATTAKILDYNLKMTIRRGDCKTRDTILEMCKSLKS